MKPYRGTAVIVGIMGQSPFAGVAWQVLHYIEGLRRLGFDTYYVDDTGSWPFDPERNACSEDCRYTVDYIGRMMAGLGLADHWAYVAGAQERQRVHGMSRTSLDQLLARADVLVNVTASTWLWDEYLQIPVRIYMETDPVQPQIEIAQGNQSRTKLRAAHTHHFTFGENIGTPGCDVPVVGCTYFPTRQPVILDWWDNQTAEYGPASTPPTTFTTVASWRQSGKDIEWNGSVYTWSKHLQLLQIVELPEYTAQPLELALAAISPAEKRMLANHGWRIADAVALTKANDPYRDYIRSSRGELSVAKDQYARPQSGWFSDRSACYLAASRPVILQDTGFGRILPTGKGLYAFRTVDDILAALDAINSDYPGNCQAARDIAHEYFAAEKVIDSVIERAGL